ncbi:MAG: cupin domain-containing protein [Thaumarchaeota archaeon]|nr:cupin domain-containing protein [Nitrososphaerota archaeon]
MAKVIPLKDVSEVVHPDWLQKAGIRDFREWIMSADDTMMVVYASIGPHGNSGAPVRHDHEEAAFVISGELNYVVEGEEFNVKANTSIFIPEGEEHFIRNDTDDTVTRLSIHTLNKTK